MKKVVIFVIYFLMMGVINVAAAKLNLNVGGVDPTPGTEERPRGPVLVPSVDQDGSTLTFLTSYADFTLQLFDEDGSLVFTTYIPSTLTTVTLPSTLSGEYEILLLPDTGSIYFFGTITL